MSVAQHDEASRLSALIDLDVLDTPPETAFDSLVQVAAAVCNTPIALLTLIDLDRQWFKANVGLEGVSETPREWAFCARTIEAEGLFEVPDTSSDSRFINNPLVTGDPNIRFYAGATLRLSCGKHVGTLCVIDKQPGKLTPQQASILAHLSRVAVQALEYRQAARQLATSEQHFRALSAAAPLGIFRTDADGACTYTNERWQSIFKLNWSEALGHGWSTTLHPADKHDVFTEWTRAAQARSDFDMEFRILHNDGRVVYVRAISRPILNADGTVLSHIGSVEDVTERREREQALQRSEWLLTETGQLADVGGWELDLITKHLKWTAQTYRIHGVPETYQPRLEQAIEFYAPEARPVISNAIERAITDRTGWDLELPFVKADGESIWVRAVGHVEFHDQKPARLIGIFQNITDRVLQRQALEDAHERINVATQSGNIGVWDWDIQTGKMDWTPQMFTLYGLSPESPTASYDFWMKHIHPDDRNSVDKRFRDAIQSDIELDIEFRIIWPDDSVHYIRSSTKITRNTKGIAVRMLGVNWDITPLRRLSIELAEQHELLHVTLQSIGDAVITSDISGHVTWLNPAAEQMTGWSCKEAHGLPLTQVFKIVDEKTRQPTGCSVYTCLTQHDKSEPTDDRVLISRNGDEFGVVESSAPMRSKAGDLLGVVLVFHDVTEQRRLTQEMHYRATHDVLTGLINRVEFETHLQKTLNTALNPNSNHALMCIDLDRFKLVNDVCGHSEGDKLLIQVARFIKNMVRPCDTVARLGGDEFGVILEDCESSLAQSVAQRICDGMNDFRFTYQDRRFSVGASVGLVFLDKRWTDVELAMQAADSSCLAAKEAGRNRVHVWFETDKAMRARRKDMHWATRLEQALDEGKFVLYAQRINKRLTQQKGINAELLIRMHDKDNKLILPNTFLSAAERFNLITKVDRWVLQNALQLLSHSSNLSQTEMLYINLSGQSVGDREFHKDAVHLLKEFGSAVCHRLCLEITETAAVTNILDAALFIEQVRALGVHVALDDFGSGASSFGYLKSLPVDILKIDGQFVKGVLNDPLDRAAVRCFIDVAEAMKLKTVAECVENQSILDYLDTMGIDSAQGFFLHKPEPLENVFVGSQGAVV